MTVVCILRIIAPLSCDDHYRVGGKTKGRPTDDDREASPFFGQVRVTKATTTTPPTTTATTMATTTATTTKQSLQDFGSCFLSLPRIPLDVRALPNAVKCGSFANSAFVESFLALDVDTLKTGIIKCWYLLGLLSVCIRFSSAPSKNRWALEVPRIVPASSPKLYNGKVPATMPGSVFRRCR